MICLQTTSSMFELVSFFSRFYPYILLKNSNLIFSFILLYIHQLINHSLDFMKIYNVMVNL